MNEVIFREKSLEKIKSPENLNDYIRVSNPAVWLILAAVIFLLIGILIWGFFGHIDTTVNSYAVVKNGEECFYNNVIICEEKYFGYYKPLTNSDGTIVGMIFAGKPTKQVEKESMRAIFWVPIMMVFFFVIGIFVSKAPARDITDAIGKEKKFLRSLMTFSEMFSMMKVFRYRGKR